MEISRGKVRYVIPSRSIKARNLGIEPSTSWCGKRPSSRQPRWEYLFDRNIKAQWSELEHPIIGSERKRFFDRAMMID